MNMDEEILSLHEKYGGKVGTYLKVRLHGNIPYVYSPGVAVVSNAILGDNRLVSKYTMKRNAVAIVSDGSRVLGLGNIRAHAALPVMEGKALLFKALADIDAFPLCLSSQDPDVFVETVKNISPGFGGINLEDIASPKCFEIEGRLKSELEHGDTPVLVCHDDQHGTAVVVVAALRNALKVVNKRLDRVKVVFIGCGAAGCACFRLLRASGMNSEQAIVFNDKGTLYDGKPGLLPHESEVAKITNKERLDCALSSGQAFRYADVIISLSRPGPGIITPPMLRQMSERPIVFALAMPTPEIGYWEAKEAGAAVVATGLPHYPNQVNDILTMPAIFRGALDVGASGISEGMLQAVADATSETVRDSELSESYILPKLGKRLLVAHIAATVAHYASSTQGVQVQRPMGWDEEYDEVMRRLTPFR